MFHSSTLEIKIELFSMVKVYIQSTLVFDFKNLEKIFNLNFGFSTYMKALMALPSKDEA